jgi:hypothetical protein
MATSSGALLETGLVSISAPQKIPIGVPDLLRGGACGPNNFSLRTGSTLAERRCVHRLLLEGVRAKRLSPDGIKGDLVAND